MQFEKPLHEVNHIFSIGMDDKSFDFVNTIVNETKKYCTEQGHEIVRLIFVGMHDLQIDITGKSHIQTSSDVHLHIAKNEHGEKVAVVVMGSSIEAS